MYDKMDYSKLNGIVPAIIQDSKTSRVLMLGFMNEEALEKTMRERKVTFYSRTKQRLWTKGEESGNFLYVEDILEDCDRDTLLIKVKPTGPVCHTGSDTCFDELNLSELQFLIELQEIIDQRKQELPEDSYTAKLFKKGLNGIAQKVGEEAVELILEAKDQNDDLFLNEAADLLFHMQVLISFKGYSIKDVIRVLSDRHRK
ncbi:MAG: bifunctional phosphoribosyl-AMP cyclohydrolase/phosphoribosyl-ATP diphosphatase HisIE [Bacteroidales bacterium]|nr:bifunctional phosphoribosyl-AMP cyclohydrolase/phosphoribosyl-ATP diphosphatase HisIE [Bacteroidales bacterium]